MTVVDFNGIIGHLLGDLAAAQAIPAKRFGYKRASKAILSLEEPLETIVSSTAEPKIPGIGPASWRVIHEVLATGESATVERAVAASGRASEIAKRRLLRANFLSRSAVRRALADPELPGPRLQDYRGDFQMHTEWSDGATSIAAMAEAFIERGYAYSAITDHSHGLWIAGGMSMEDVTDQHIEIDRLNKEYRGRLHILKGVEANIGADGALDLSPDDAARFEVVLAAPHSKLRIRDDQTDRLLAAVANPAVRILAHPRGRMANSRLGVQADWNRVFQAAAAAGVAVEIDGDPWRQDLDYSLAREALAAGCLFSLDSDAHAPSQLRYAETAIAHARLAGIPMDRIVNCWPLDDLLEWLADRSALRTPGQRDGESPSTWLHPAGAMH
jgi:histidinol phosphatase-like PHP family hydrolase